MQLRDYQIAAVDACWEYISNAAGNPCISLPTGAGKSLVLAQLAHDAATKWGGRVIILAHVKELLEQNRDKLKALSPDLDIGVYSAGLNRRDRKAQVLIAGIQSVYSKACDFDPFDAIIVDECHLLPPDGEGMYRRFLSDCKIISPHVRLIGLTATEYRTSTGWLCGPDNLLNDICYRIGVKELILQGWLSKLISQEPIKTDVTKLHIRGGEFITDEATALMESVIAPACGEILARTESRRSVLVFCQSVDHAIRVKETINSVCLCRVELITGGTPAKQRAEILRDFKAGTIKYLVNVNVLTTGFDAPNVDCVCLLRPTASPGLYYQMVGRGFRLHPGKENCLVLDFGGNVRRHGPVDQIEPKPHQSKDKDGNAPTKTCPNCDCVIHAAYTICPNCQHEFPATEVTHDRNADNAPITSLETVRTDYDVIDVAYNFHRPKDINKPPSMRVDYRVNNIKWFSEWICFEHEGYAGNKAALWWKARSPDRVPATVEDAIAMANNGSLAMTEQITVQERSGEKFPRIVKAKLGPKPEKITADSGDDSFEFPTHEPTREFTDEEIMELPF